MRVIFIVSLSLVSYGQIVKFERDQPLLNVTYSLQNCCLLVKGSYLDLWQCVNRTNKNMKSNPEFTLLSFATPNIIEFSSYSYAVNMFYAQQNNYNFLYLTPDAGANHEPRDPRWNKVVIYPHG